MKAAVIGVIALGFGLSIANAQQTGLLLSQVRGLVGLVPQARRGLVGMVRMDGGKGGGGGVPATSDESAAALYVRSAHVISTKK